jgi:hypothetical protein
MARNMTIRIDLDVSRIDFDQVDSDCLLFGKSTLVVPIKIFSGDELLDVQYQEIEIEQDDVDDLRY